MSCFTHSCPGNAEEACVLKGLPFYWLKFLKNRILLTGFDAFFRGCRELPLSLLWSDFLLLLIRPAWNVNCSSRNAPLNTTRTKTLDFSDDFFFPDKILISET